MNKAYAPIRRVLMRSALPAALLAGLAGFGQGAQAAPAAADQNTVGEVVVTAQFREQSLQQTPLAITAVNAQMLENKSQTNLAQVASEAPNVTLKPAGAAFGNAMVAFIRGVGQTDFNFSQEPGVGVYVDDVYYATLTGSLLDWLTSTAWKSCADRKAPWPAGTPSAAPSRSSPRSPTATAADTLKAPTAV